MTSPAGPQATQQTVELALSPFPPPSEYLPVRARLRQVVEDSDLSSIAFSDSVVSSLI